MTGFFFYGTLRHAPLRRAILGRHVKGSPAQLQGYSVVGASESPVLAVLLAGSGSVAGDYVPALTDEEMARLDYYQTGFGFHSDTLEILIADGRTITAHVYLLRQDGVQPTDTSWDIDVWRERWAAISVAATEDYMSHFGECASANVRRRFGQMLTRAGARMRAEGLRAGTCAVRRRSSPEDVIRQQLSHPYSAYFAVEEHDLSYRRFDGSMGPRLNRAVFISGDASIVLPYDPVRDRVMVIEQFRAGPYARGDANPWLLEAVAGRIDGGETPEEAARREAVEEAGLHLKTLLPGPRYYPSPAAKAEYLYSFIGIADLSDDKAGVGGLEAEAEDIRSHIIPFDRLMELVASGEVDNAPLLVLAYFLQALRPSLREKISPE